jgi:hypothetical protein
MKSLEQMLHEKDEELRELRKKVGKSGATSLARELSESGLPEAAIARLKRKLPANASTAVVKAMITEEKNYVLGVRAGAHRQSQDSQALELVEGYKALGLSEKEAKIAARVESAVKDVNESQARLANAVRLLGLSEKEAAVFSRI